MSYLINEAIAKARYGNADKMNFEAPLTSLVWLTSIVSVALTYVVSYLLIPDLGDGIAVVEAVDDHHLRHARRRDHPGAGEDLHLDASRAHVREVVTSSREGGASLNILSGLVAGNFSAFWIGMAIMALMAIAYGVSTLGHRRPLMMAPAVFAFGLVAFGFLGMGPVTIAVDRYGPVTDNAQSVYELSHDRADARHRAGASRASTASRRTSSARSTCSRRTTAPATRSRRPPSRC